MAQSYPNVATASYTGCEHTGVRAHSSPIPEKCASLYNGLLEYAPAKLRMQSQEAPCHDFLTITGVGSSRGDLFHLPPSPSPVLSPVLLSLSCLGLAPSHLPATLHILPHHLALTGHLHHLPRICSCTVGQCRIWLLDSFKM